MKRRIQMAGTLVAALMTTLGVSSQAADQFCKMSVQTRVFGYSGIIYYGFGFTIDSANQIVSNYAVDKTTTSSELSFSPGAGTLQGSAGTISYPSAYLTVNFDLSTSQATLLQQLGINQTIVTSRVSCEPTPVPVFTSFITNSTSLNVTLNEVASQNGQGVGHVLNFPVTAYTDAVTRIQLKSASPITVLDQFFNSTGDMIATCQGPVLGQTSAVQLLPGSAGYSCQFSNL